MRQNPSPMVEHTRSHERIAQRPMTGRRSTIDNLLAKPVELFVTPAAEEAAEVDLLIHFHGSPWLAMQAAEESKRPLIVAGVNLGAGSGRYVAEFSDPSLFTRLLSAVGRPLRRVYLSGFSAGCGAIREILKTHADSIAGALFIDGIHTSYIPEGKVLHEGGKLDETKLESIAAYARRAIRGEKRMIVTHSEIFPGTFASTTETADGLLGTLGLKRTPVVQWGPLGMQQLSETRAGNLLVLGYAGNSAPDHIDHFHAIGWFLERLLSPDGTAFRRLFDDREPYPADAARRDMERVGRSPRES
jgi:hypothetical protein